MKRVPFQVHESGEANEDVQIKGFRYSVRRNNRRFRPSWKAGPDVSILHMTSGDIIPLLLIS